MDLKSCSVLRARVSDIGRGGCYLDVFCPFPLQTPVKLRITNERVSFVAQAHVVYAKMGMGMGVEFTDVEAEQLQVLESWLHELGDDSSPDNKPALLEIAKRELPSGEVNQQQWLVLHELVIALLRKGVLEPAQAERMILALMNQKVSQQQK